MMKYSNQPASSSCPSLLVLQGLTCRLCDGPFPIFPGVFELEFGVLSLGLSVSPGEMQTESCLQLVGVNGHVVGVMVAKLDHDTREGQAQALVLLEVDVGAEQVLRKHITEAGQLVVWVVVRSRSWRGDRAWPALITVQRHRRQLEAWGAAQHANGVELRRVWDRRHGDPLGIEKHGRQSRLGGQGLLSLLSLPRPLHIAQQMRRRGGGVRAELIAARAGILARGRIQAAVLPMVVTEAVQVAEGGGRDRARPCAIVEGARCRCCRHTHICAQKKMGGFDIIFQHRRRTHHRSGRRRWGAKADCTACRRGMRAARRGTQTQARG